MLTTAGVRMFLEHLEKLRPQPRHVESNNKAKRWIEEELLPEMEAMEMTVGRPESMTVGKSSKEMPVSIALEIGTTSFSAEFTNDEVDTVSVSWGRVSKRLTVSQLIEVLENHRF